MIVNTKASNIPHSAKNRTIDKFDNKYDIRCSIGLDSIPIKGGGFFSVEK